MNKRPTTYVEWRALLHRTARDIGMSAGFDWRRHRRFRMDRDIWKMVHRFDRVKRRLDAEFEAMDSTCAMAILDAVFNRKGAA